MHQDMELEFRALLNRFGDTGQVIEKTLFILNDENSSYRKKLSVMNFAINAGYFSHVFSLFPAWFKNAEQVPWAQFIDILTKSNFKPGKEFLELLFTGAAETGALESVIFVSRWQKVEPRFQRLQNQFHVAHKEKLENLRRRLFEKLEFARQHRMIDEENRLLLKIAAIFPDDPIIAKEQESFKERWARNVIAKSAHKKVEAQFQEKKPLPLNDLEQGFIDNIYLAAMEMADEIPERAYDLCLCFYFMEQYNEALSMVRRAPDGPGPDWIYLELLLLCRHFVECLDEVGSIEMKYAHDPESTFAATYIRAQALWGLGQTGAAIELVRSIVELRPHYRSAHSLLNEWGGLS